MQLSELHQRKPKARMKKVWNKDEHLGKHKDRWYNSSYASKSEPYKWSKSGSFHGQSEGYKDHII